MIPNGPWPLISWKSYLTAMTKFGIYSDCIVVSDNWPRGGYGMSRITEDFQIMLNADYLFRGNSSFSWWAGELGKAKVFSPVVPDKHGVCDVDFVPGNSQPFTPHGTEPL